MPLPPTPPLLAVDQTLGRTLAGDSDLQSLPGSALTTILQRALPGVTGATGKAQAVAPEAAGAFVAGLISSTVAEPRLPALLRGGDPQERLEEYEC